MLHPLFSADELRPLPHEGPLHASTQHNSLAPEFDRATEGRPVPEWLHRIPLPPDDLPSSSSSALIRFQPPSNVGLSEQLNPQQRQVILAPPQPTLVLAGAGSGKTHTLIHRVAELLQQGLNPEQILLITFTRKAAEEMIHRTQTLLNQSPLRIQGGTFHAMALVWLKLYGGAIGLHQKFSIMDEDDAMGLIHVLASKRGFMARPGFPKKHSIAAVFSRTANTLRPIPDIIATAFPWLNEHTPQLGALYRTYTDTKWQQHRLDYDDLLFLFYKLLCLDTPTRARLSHQYKAVLVDEYQDVTRVQVEIVRLLAAEYRHLMVVGDDGQSIFGFRGAQPDSMREFMTVFPDAAICRLEQNYRSTSPILVVANAVLADAKGLISKTLFTTRTHGDLPALITCESEVAQSQFITSRIQDFERIGIPLNKIAVLFRSSSHSFDLEAHLTKQRVPFVKYGGLQLTETAHVKDVLAYLRVSDNPLDAGAWHRVLLLLDRVGAKLAQRLIEAMQNSERPLDVLEQVSGKYHTVLQHLAAVVRSVQDEAIPLPARIELVLHHYAPLLRRDYGTEASHRLEDLRQLAALAEQAPSLEVFLQDITLDPSAARPARDGNQSTATLTLSTVHSAKGLEWDVVFVIWLLDGQFPPVRSWYDDAALEEERRLFYVAVTRARFHLFLTYPVEHYHHGAQQLLTHPNRFLKSVSLEHLQRLHAVEEA